ncbi:MAG: type II secretion system protein GspL [Sphingomonadaceae bacterium]
MTRLLLLTDAAGVTTLADGSDGPVVGVIPGDDVALHRVILAATGKARMAEARAMAETLCATPIAEVHLALGPEDEEGKSWLALADPDRVEAHLARLRASGVEPDALVPAPLLLPEPKADTAAAARLGNSLLVRRRDLAACLEPPLAEALGAPADPPPFVPAPAPEAELPLDLLQGRFAHRTRWWRDRVFRIAAGVLLGLALLLALVPVVAAQLRAGAAGRFHDEAVVAMASRVLGREVASAAEGAAALQARQAERLQGSVVSRLLPLLAALEGEPRLDIQLLRFGNGALEVALGGPPEAVNALAAGMASAPFAIRQDGETLRIGEPKAPEATGRTPSETRFLKARADAAALAGTPAAGGDGPAADRLARLLSDVGVAEPPVSSTPAGGASVALPAVRSALLLPLLARIEGAGLGFARLEIARNEDSTLAVFMEVR